MVAIIDYKTGNLDSVCNALKRLGAEFVLTSDRTVIERSDKVLMPGVGEASSAMKALEETGLVPCIMNLKQPVLGICIGMQLMCLSSEEGNTECLGIFRSRVRRLQSSPGEGIKVPHVGWNRVTSLKSPLFKGIPEGTYFYFVHSYAAGICDDTAAATCHGGDFSAALQSGRRFGVQFHPEKSGAAGAKLLKNYLEL
ncbi:MAG: imidazole glycerol phosphate synthase subunit HisH [Bacteroidales bacterium]|jgi:glutamine amidotransferase|nr:imidazole glycerol phosphate synthase subunit HisH [Bacteroidales bacterium]MCI2121823.1 imidazole glycerol phosphate synthase subunit HisH [Bacteroidales bacterium]MCI2146054.1 imidazole glycerol phosphate synthase subunit HisH [Bacteroidales bacterium]